MIEVESSDRAVGRPENPGGGNRICPPVEIGLIDLTIYGRGSLDPPSLFLSNSPVNRDKFANVCTFQPFSNSRHCSSVYALKIGIFFGKHELVDTKTTSTKALKGTLEGH